MKFLDLPSELIVAILSHTDTIDILHCFLTCSKLNTIVKFEKAIFKVTRMGRFASDITPINPNIPTISTFSYMNLFCNSILTQIGEGMFSFKIDGGSKINDAQLTKLSLYTPKLKHLSVTNASNITDSGFDEIQNWINLESVNVLGCTKLTDSLFSKFVQFINLTSLNVSGCFAIADASLQSILSNCPKITLVDASYCWRITDAAFERPSEGLQFLYLQFCYQVTARVFTYLSHYPDLVCVDLSHCVNITFENSRELREKGVVLIQNGIEIEE